VIGQISLHRHTAYRLWLPFQRVGKHRWPGGSFPGLMSWSPVATANSDGQAKLNHIPSPSRTSASRAPIVRSDVESGSGTTEVPPTSCPLSRTSSQPKASRAANTLESRRHLPPSLRLSRLYDVLIPRVSQSFYSVLCFICSATHFPGGTHELRIHP
jgi:hypothetical protein